MGQQMYNKSTLLKKIMEYDFAMLDLNLYLDTHPSDNASIEIYNSLKEKERTLQLEYIKRFGPITANQVTSDNYWTWISEPWPWEGGCN